MSQNATDRSHERQRMRHVLPLLARKASTVVTKERHGALRERLSVHEEMRSVDKKTRSPHRMRVLVERERLPRHEKRLLRQRVTLIVD
jgi:hypothetical protein